MMVVYEFFAYNYSYSKEETKQLSIPEALFFYSQLKERQKQETINKISEWEVLLAIATNPHAKPQDARRLPQELKKMKQRVEGKEATPQDIEKNLDQLRRLLGSK